MPDLSRRELLQLLGISVSGAALGGCNASWMIPDKHLEEALRGPGVETFKNAVCQLCPAGCGIRVRLVDGLPVHIDGNPLHPVNRGGICPQGLAGLDYLYHPDRVQQPLARNGERGQSQWKAISWDEAIDTVVRRLRDLRANRTPEQVGFLVHQKRGLMYELISRFMEDFGSRNIIALDESHNDALPFELLFGWPEVPEYDIENAKFVLSFGANLLEDGASPVHTIWAYNKMRGGGGGERGRLVFIDSRHSLTAASADNFISIKPGTHGAVALGIAYVLIKERYYDHPFIAAHVNHFDPWVGERGIQHTGFRNHVLSKYYPERVSRICGVPAKTIVDVAREFGRTRPSLAVVGQLGSAGTNGFWNTLAVLALNILVGNIEKKGGLRMQRSVPFEDFPPITPDVVAKGGLSQPPLDEDTFYRFPLRSDSLFNACENMLSSDQRKLDTLFVYGTNPAFDHPHAKRVRQFFDEIPFIVSFASILDESSEYADLVLPEHTYLERWMDSGPAPGVTFANASVSAPVVEPLYQTRHAGDVVIDLAYKVSRNAALAFSHRDFLATLKSRFHGIFASGEGTVISGSFEESWLQFLKERGWQNLAYESFDEFWNVLVDRGGWWDAAPEEMPPHLAIQTEDGKIPLYMTRLAAQLGKVLDRSEAPGATDAVLNRWGISVQYADAFMPHHEEPNFAESETEYPYALLVFNVLANRRGSGSFSPMLQEMFGYYRRLCWSSWVELNPETALHHHLRDGDAVRVQSERGSITAPVVINEALESQCVAVPFGLGHTSFGRYAKGIGVNPYNILAISSDHLFGKPATLATRVRIEKHKGG